MGCDEPTKIRTIFRAKNRRTGRKNGKSFQGCLPRAAAAALYTPAIDGRTHYYIERSRVSRFVKIAIIEYKVGRGGSSRRRTITCSEPVSWLGIPARSSNSAFFFPGRWVWGPFKHSRKLPIQYVLAAKVEYEGREHLRGLEFNEASVSVSSAHSLLTAVCVCHIRPPATSIICKTSRCS